MNDEEIQAALDRVKRALESSRVISSLPELMFQNRQRIADVHKCTELSRPTLDRLYDSAGDSIHFNTIIALCALYECEIGDLLRIVPKTGENAVSENSKTNE